MRISLSVKPRAHADKVEKLSESEYVVWVRVAALEGRANDSVVKLLSAYFGISKTRVEIVRGHNSRKKLIDIVI